MQLKVIDTVLRCWRCQSACIDLTPSSNGIIYTHACGFVYTVSDKGDVKSLSPCSGDCTMQDAMCNSCHHSEFKGD